MVGFVFFPPSPRHVCFRRGARAWRAQVRGRAQKVALTVDADDALLDCSRRGLAARYAAASRQGNAGACRCDQKALRPAGDEGDRRRNERRPGGGRGLCRRSRIVCCSTPAPPRDGDAAGRARQALRLDLLAKCRSRRAIHAVRRARCRQRRRGPAHHARPRRRRFLRRRARAGREGSRKRSAPSCAPRGRRRRVARQNRSRVTA